jgi:hypothetical protein
MWGTSWRQRLRLTPLYVAMMVADWVAAMTPARTPPAPSPWRPGVTVIIPERDAPDMLSRALVSLQSALAVIDEPRQVIVVANGAPRSPTLTWPHAFPRSNGYTSTLRSVLRERSSADCATRVTRARSS